MKKTNQMIMNKMILKVRNLPDIRKLISWTELNQAGHIEYHVMILQYDSNKYREGLITMKHYCFIESNYNSQIPSLESMEYNVLHMDYKEFDFINSIKEDETLT